MSPLETTSVLGSDFAASSSWPVTHSDSGLSLGSLAPTALDSPTVELPLESASLIARNLGFESNSLFRQADLSGIRHVDWTLEPVEAEEDSAFQREFSLSHFLSSDLSQEIVVEPTYAVDFAQELLQDLTFGFDSLSSLGHLALVAPMGVDAATVLPQDASSVAVISPLPEVLPFVYPSLDPAEFNASKVNAPEVNASEAAIPLPSGVASVDEAEPSAPALIASLFSLAPVIAPPLELAFEVTSAVPPEVVPAEQAGLEQANASESEFDSWFDDLVAQPLTEALLAPEAIASQSPDASFSEIQNIESNSGETANPDSLGANPEITAPAESDRELIEVSPSVAEVTSVSPTPLSLAGLLSDSIPQMIEGDFGVLSPADEFDESFLDWAIDWVEAELAQLLPPGTNVDIDIDINVDISLPNPDAFGSPKVVEAWLQNQ